MPQKFLIEGWDSFSDDEQKKLKQLINLSLEAQEIRFSLMDNGDNLVDREFEVTSDQADPQAIPIMRTIPRVGRFLEAWQLFGPNSDEIRRCEEGCDRRFSDNEQQRNKCSKDCRKKRFALVENILNANTIIEV